MSEVNWDLAPEGSVAIGQRNSSLAFMDADGHVFLNGRWGISLGWKTIATRPTQKTVEDAVEYHKEVWPNDDYGYLNFDSKHGWYCSDKGLFVTLICTREQFEACVTKKGEKWTHVTRSGAKCNVIAETKNRVWIVYENGDDNLVNKLQIKPIKPTISETDLLYKIKDMGKGVASDGHFGDTVRGWFDKYDII